MKKTTFTTVAILATLIFSIFFVGCKKEDKVEPTPTEGSVTIEYDHRWGMTMENFSMGQYKIQPKTQDSLQVTSLKYYVSNIQLKKADGTWWKEVESYYLVDGSNPSSMNITIDKVPSGEYVEMRYTLGVDSARNVSGAQTGALSIANGMYWNTEYGYIMTKMEGNSPNSPTGKYSLHLGGFEGEFNVVTEKSTNFNNEKLAIGTGSPRLHFLVNVARFWHTNPGVSTLNVIELPGAQAKQAAKDFYQGFVFDHIHK